MCLLTAPWVTESSSAAALRLCNRAVVSKARSALRDKFDVFTSKKKIRG